MAISELQRACVTLTKKKRRNWKVKNDKVMDAEYNKEMNRLNEAIEAGMTTEAELEASESAPEKKKAPAKKKPSARKILK